MHTPPVPLFVLQASCLLVRSGRQAFNMLPHRHQVRRRRAQRDRRTGLRRQILHPDRVVDQLDC